MGRRFKLRSVVDRTWNVSGPVCVVTLVLRLAAAWAGIALACYLRNRITRLLMTAYLLGICRQRVFVRSYVLCRVSRMSEGTIMTGSGRPIVLVDF